MKYYVLVAKISYNKTFVNYLILILDKAMGFIIKTSMYDV
jgi:hypothetical protein